MFMAKIIIDNSKLSADSVIKNGVNKAMLSAPRLAKEMIITVPSKLLFFLFCSNSSNSSSSSPKNKYFIPSPKGIRPSKPKIHSSGTSFRMTAKNKLTTTSAKEPIICPKVIDKWLFYQNEHIILLVI